MASPSNQRQVIPLGDPQHRENLARELERHNAGECNGCAHCDAENNSQMMAKE